MTDDYKGCHNCYFEEFDERVYPCSLCIRGVKRSDYWTEKHDSKTEEEEE